MKWYYTIAGGHTHVRVFMNGAKCGDLCFRNEEFRLLLTGSRPAGVQHFVGTLGQAQIEFIDETATSRNHPEPGDIDYFRSTGRIE